MTEVKVQRYELDREKLRRMRKEDLIDIIDVLKDQCDDTLDAVHNKRSWMTLEIMADIPACYLEEDLQVTLK